MGTYTVIEGRQVTEENIAAALALDRLVYPEVYQVTLQQCLQWNRRNNRIYTMLRHNGTGEIVAYANLSPVTVEYYDRIVSGAFLDTLLPPEAIVPYDHPGTYQLYFSSAVVHPQFRNSAVLGLLMRAALSKLTALAEEGCLIQRMAADAVSGGGERLCRLFGMEKRTASDHSSGIFEVTQLPPDFRITPLTRELYRLYWEYFHGKTPSGPFENIP